MDNIFVYLSGQYYFLPDLASFASPNMAERYGISAGIIPYPGIRGGAGYEWKRLSLGVETGYTYIKGDNPLVLEVVMIPLMFKTGFSFYPIPRYKHFSITPTAAIGTVFANAEHYVDVIDMLTDRLSHSTNTGLFTQAGIRIGWNPFPSLNRKIELFAGASVDLIIETGGLIPLPQAELGFLIRPFVRKTPRTANVIQQIEIIEIEEIEPEIEIPEEEYEETFEHEETEEPEFVIMTRLVFFPPDETIPAAEGLAVLDNAAETLSGYIDFRITVRGFAAPFVSVTGQREVSRQRALYCANYFIEEHGIAEELITIEWLGADGAPEDTAETDHSRRRSAEITIEGWRLP